MIRTMLSGQTAEESPVAAHSPAHVLWMCDQIQNLDQRNLEHALEAARWIGWMVSVMEQTIPEWGNDTSRNLIREDVHAGRDRAI